MDDAPRSSGATPAPDTEPRHGSGQKLLSLLEALGQSSSPRRLGDLAEATGLTKPTVHRLLAVLTSDGWAVAGDGGFYRIGPRAKALAIEAQSEYDPVERVLSALALDVNQTVHAGMLADGRVLYTHKANAPANLHMHSRVGHSMPVHSTALGKAILAQLPDDRAREVLRTHGTPAVTTATMTDPEAVLAECTRTRERGYAVDREENEDNVRCIAVAVRPSSGGIAGVSISSITFLTDEDTLLALAPRLVHAARLVEKAW